MANEYSADYFRHRKMGRALDAPFDLHSPALTSYRRAARMLLVQPGMRLLDAGCGLGAGSWLLAMLGAQVTGIDVSAEAIAWARATYGPTPLRKGGSLHFEVGDLRTWESPPRYDGILVGDVLEHFARPVGIDVLRRLLNALDTRDQPSDRGWCDGLFLHLPITANLIDWPLIVKNRLLVQRLRRQVIDHHGDTTHVMNYRLRDVAQVTHDIGGQVCKIELRIYRHRLRWLERAVLAGGHPALARAGGQLITDCDAVVLPELVAALRLAPAADVVYDEV